MWNYTNIRYFKFKYLRNIYVFISNLDFLKIKYINILYRDWLFENFFLNYIVYFVLFAVVLYLL